MNATTDGSSNLRGKAGCNTQAARILALVCAAHFGAVAIGQDTNGLEKWATNQMPVKTQSHVERPNTYNVDLTGGRAKAQPKAEPGKDQRKQPEKKPSLAESLSKISLQSDAIRFPVELQGPTNAFVRVGARYDYIVTNMQPFMREATRGGAFGREQQAPLVLDMFLKEILAGSLTNGSAVEGAKALLDMSDKYSASSRLQTADAKTERLAGRQIAALGYLALRYTKYVTAPDIESEYKPKIRFHLTNSASWHPWSTLLKWGLTSASLQKTTTDIPLVGVDPEYTQPVEIEWGNVDYVAWDIQGRQIQRKPSIFLIYCNSVDNTAYERVTFQTSTMQQFRKLYKPCGFIKAVCDRGYGTAEGEMARNLHGEYGVKTYPTTLFIGGDGKELGRIGSEVTGDAAMISAIEKFLNQERANIAQETQDYIDTVRARRGRTRPATPFR